MVTIVRNDVCRGGAWVLDLDAAVGGEGEEGHGAVVVERVGAVLPVDVGLDAGGVGGVGVVLVLDFFKEAVVGAGRRGSVSGREGGTGRTYKE